MLDNIATLLPLRGLEVTLQFIDSTRFSFFHQPAVHAFIRHLLGSPEKFDTLLTIDAPETGRIDYHAGQRYRFAVYALANGEVLLKQLITLLQQLPASAAVTDLPCPIRDNVQSVALVDLFTQTVIEHGQALSCYGVQQLEADLQIWQSATSLKVSWLSPVRLLKAKASRIGLKGEARFCREYQDLGKDLFLQRLYDGFSDLLKRRGVASPARSQVPVLPDLSGHLFWVDDEYHNSAGQASPVGGMMGEYQLGTLATIPLEWLQLLVVGQYLGMGQRRAMGLGRFRLETEDGCSTVALVEPAQYLLRLAATTGNLQAAYEAISSHQKTQAKYQQDEPQPQDESWWRAWYPDLPKAEEDEFLADQLESLSSRLQDSDLPPVALQGVIVNKNDGSKRGLAIPPFWDRVAQRAVTQLLTQGLDQLMHPNSYGYRRGRSRHNASKTISLAWRQGYRWVYEADIEDFFDNVLWQHVAIRLKAFYRDDPVVDKILAWISVPVDYQGFIIERQQGLPQGAPVSPLLANLLLDDLDQDLQSAGFKLVRFADDFVVLCKSREKAEAAHQQVKHSLDALELELNAEKTGVVSYDQGFKYLGYLFVKGLAVDVGGEKSTQDARLKKPEPHPASSWMAKISERPVTAIEDFSKNKSLSSVDEKRLQLGERDESGSVLIVTGKSALITTRNGRLQLTRDDQLESDIPWRGLNWVLLIGNHHLSTPAIRAAMEVGVPVYLASRGGQYQGVMLNGLAGAGNRTLWLLQQELFTHEDAVLPLAKQVVMARIRHMRELLRQRDPSGHVTARMALQGAMTSAGAADSLTILNGVEGSATRVYFKALKKLVPPAYEFSGRNRRPPKDPFNALLSLGYTILHTYIETLLQVDGFYPWTGFYHQSHGRHAALASDLIEPFRHLVERVALTAVISGKIKPDEFYQDPQLGCRLSPTALRRYLAMLWERLDRPVMAVGELEPRSIPEHIHQQNCRLEDWLREGKDFKAWVSR